MIRDHHDKRRSDSRVPHVRGISRRIYSVNEGVDHRKSGPLHSTGDYTGQLGPAVDIEARCRRALVCLFYDQQDADPRRTGRAR